MHINCVNSTPIYKCSLRPLYVAADLVKNVTASFKENRDETGEFIGTLFTRAEEQSKNCDIDPVLPEQRVRKMPRQHIFYPVIDCIISELDRRFSEQSLTVMIGIQALTPRHKSFWNFDNIKSFILLYNSNVEDHSHEISKVGRFLQRSGSSTGCTTNMATMLELACFLEPYKLTFH